MKKKAFSRGFGCRPCRRTSHNEKYVQKVLDLDPANKEALALRANQKVH